MQKKILVVEDDPDLVELLRFNLKTQGYAMGTAADGIEALKKARSIQPDLILLDLMLPELDGFAVCDILRRDPKTASIPIIILSAISSQLSRFNALDAGANVYLTKPFSPKYLLAAVHDLLHAAPRRLRNPGHETKRTRTGDSDPPAAIFSSATTKSQAE